MLKNDLRRGIPQISVKIVFDIPLFNILNSTPLTSSANDIKMVYIYSRLMVVKEASSIYPPSPT